MSHIKTCVSLYSLQDEYLNKRMSLEDILAFLADNGVEGIEILPDQMMHNTPHPSEKTVQQWFELLDKYKMKAVVADVFLNTNLYKNRELTQRESVNLIIDEIKLANRLGIKLIRLVSMVPAYIIEPVLPYCEKYDVKIALEIHAGMSFDHPQTSAFIEEMKRVDSPYVGIVVDTGIFCHRLPRVMANYCKFLGANDELIEYIDNIFAQQKDLREYTKEDGSCTDDIMSLVKSDIDNFFAVMAIGYENEDFSILDEYMPYIMHFHFKLWEMTEEGIEHSIDYEGVLNYLHQKGYDGYVSTEYEGNRWVIPGNPMVEKEQVKAHQKFIKETIAKIEG